MKTFVTTNCYKDETDDLYYPDLGGYEKDLDVHYSMMKIDFPVSVLVRASGSSTKIKAIEQATMPNPQTDAQALSIIQSRYPDCDLRNVDIPDDELDNIAKLNGIDPHGVRKQTVLEDDVPGLQQQEFNLIKMVAIKKGKDYEPFETDIKHGKKGAYNNLLDKLREV